ncbi:VCBS repeat-containing protein [Tamlana flava]|uniref:VCBS repeat-containing protein n=1 Tax=Tamlana flava TaxID=3158572 RepID=UPI00351BD403
MKVKNSFIVFLVVILATGCAKENTQNKLFERISANYSGINFQNEITTNDSINILTYEYLYNGGGVGIGDFNGDDLPDVILSGNLVKSKIYLNKGDLQFDDITESSGINTHGKWCTGVSIVDINQDGLDDIYLSVGGMGNKNEFPNLLYINNGDLTFTESASEYGLADQGESIQSVFFDYDLDGDLDMYLLTGGGFEKSAINIRPILKDGQGRNTDRIYRNDFNEALGHPVFSNVSSEVGVTIEGFGLGVSVFDANNDKWPDVYVSNDYLSRDFLYINQQDGTFKEEASNYFGHISHFSMGNDVADINNDGLLDVLTVDMLPENVKRRKLMSGGHSHDIFKIALQFGYGHQHMRNMLQRNNGNKTFSEIGQLSGIDKTDWSWAPLMADFDNDGLNDIYITNGFGKDITDMDFVKYRQSKVSAFRDVEDLKKSVIDCLYARPTIKVANYAYKNKGDLTFEKVTDRWGFNEESISNGAAYADLDADGDLDLIVNNINQPAFVYRNTLREKDTLNSNYLMVQLKGSVQNKKGIGAKVSIYLGGQQKVWINQPVRGFQSSVGTILHFGLKNQNKIDSLKVEWPDGKNNIFFDLKSNQRLNVSYDKAVFQKKVPAFVGNRYFEIDTTFHHSSKDKSYNDFASQSLLMQKYSNQGPGMAVGDLNGDGLEDVFVGGAYGFNAAIHYQEKNGGFKKVELENTEFFEDEGALIFDADGDGLNDLYVASGGSERYAGHNAYQDRIYYNVNSKLILGELPEMFTSTSTVVGGDYDNDGDIDLFVGGRLVPGAYPMPPKSYILENQSGKFINVTDKVCPVLNDAGMVTSAVWTDFDNDLKLDLVVVGEFMPITMLKGNGEQLINITENSNLENTSGFWNSIQSGDFDNDGDIDFVAGNLGLNSNLKILENHPIKLDYADFDNNGSVDPIFSKYEEGKYYPIASLDQLIGQLPMIKKKFLFYNSFAKSSTQDILGLFGSIEHNTLEAKKLKTVYIENLGDNKFKIAALPLEAQVAPINGILVEDVDQDGFLDLLLVGNNYNAEVGNGRYDASIGHFLHNSGHGSFEVVDNNVSNFSVTGDSKSIVKVRTTSAPTILVGANNSEVKSFILNRRDYLVLKPENSEAFAIVNLRNGSKRRQEFTLGGGYLSQSANGIEISPSIESVVFYGRNGGVKRTVTFD